MIPTTISTLPDIESFTSLSDHHSQTPQTFFNAPPVLHYHTDNAQVLVSQDSLSRLPMLTTPANGSSNAETTGSPTEGIKAAVFVTSENIILFNTTSSTGVTIPYQSLQLHAFESQEDPTNPGGPKLRQLYMQLSFNDPDEVVDEDEVENVEVRISGIPDKELDTLYEGISRCTDLHVDVNEDMDIDGNDPRIQFEGSVGYEGANLLPTVANGVSVQDFAADLSTLPPPFPGSGGWITAENVHEHFDEDGNWRTSRTRTRDEVDEEGKDDDEPDTNGETNKRAKTNGHSSTNDEDGNGV